MSLDLQQQLREYADAVVSESSPRSLQERSAQLPATRTAPQIWSRRAVAVGAVGLAAIAVAVVLVARPVTSGAPVIDTPPSVVPSAPVTEQELVLGAVLEAAEALGTTVREFDFELGWTAGRLGFLTPELHGGDAADDLVNLESALVATVNAAFGDEPVVDEEEPGFEAHSDVFSILALRDEASASQVIANAGGSSFTDPAEWVDSEDQPSDFTYPAALAAAALGDESTYYLDGGRGVGTHLLIRHGRFLFEVSHARVPDVDRVAAAVFTALDSDVVPRVSVTPAQEVALRDTGYFNMTDIEIVGDRGSFEGHWMFEAIEDPSGNFNVCVGHDDVAFTILEDGRVIEAFGADTNQGITDDEVIADDDPAYRQALAQCLPVPSAVADLGLDLTGQEGAPSARNVQGVFLARSWRFDFGLDQMRPSVLVGPDATEVAGSFVTDASQRWLLGLDVDFRAPAWFVAERFAIDLGDVADPRAEVRVRIHHEAPDLVEDPFD